jgi:hypothetical protein
MIDWLSFLVVLAASIAGGCSVVAIFALGLRIIDGPAPWRRPVGVACFVTCGLIILYAVYLVIPLFHP